MKHHSDLVEAFRSGKPLWISLSPERWHEIQREAAIRDAVERRLDMEEIERRIRERRIK